MQNRYVGDVGDFGKLGMLRSIESCGIKIGANWYLVEDESHNQDGKHIGYLADKKFIGLDEELRNALNSLVTNNRRSINNLEKLQLLQSDIYYNNVLKAVNGSVKELRSDWHKDGLSELCDAELIFMDPDNGLLPPSVSIGSVKSIKYVTKDEIIDYYQAGHSVVFYSHRTREKLNTYLHRFDELFDSEQIKGATIAGISFKRGTVRDYFFILHEQHKARVVNGIEKLLKSGWRQHFELIEM